MKRLRQPLDLREWCAKCGKPIAGIPARRNDLPYCAGCVPAADKRERERAGK